MSDAEDDDLWGDVDDGQEQEQKLEQKPEGGGEKAEEGVEKETIAATEGGEEEVREDGAGETQAAQDKGEEFNDVFGSSDDEAARTFGGEEIMQPPQTRGEADLSDLPAPGTTETLCYVCLPPSLAIDTTPFDPDTFGDENVRPGAKTIRWRFTGEGDERSLESNTRIVKWSDGSTTLHVGKDVYDVSEAVMENHRHQIFVRQKRDTSVTQCHGSLRRKLMIKPNSQGQDLTKTLASQISKRMSKNERRAKVLAALPDGEAETHQLRQMEDERIRRLAKAENAKKREKRQYGSKLSTEFIEPNFQGDEAEYDENTFDRGSPERKQRNKGGKRSRDSSESDSSSSGSGNSSDSSEAEVVVHKAKQNKRTSAFESDSD